MGSLDLLNPNDLGRSSDLPLFRAFEGAKIGTPIPFLSPLRILTKNLRSHALFRGDCQKNSEFCPLRSLSDFLP
ncbi:hypothetical protein A0128_02330 [Leptospira tipperaryensis]|uniref:Uncharacterized protein n=1 Tax=Leptospira tipperaryensis TaxID=2564040 RepID=A0A1D7UTE2_9LEPT|nr:hypothetical protein A0128_02330 [Leptospira tipperaryensis]